MRIFDKSWSTSEEGICAMATARYAVAVLTFMIAGVGAHAQLVTGTVTGSVTDPSGSLVVGANVRLANTGTGAIQQTTSDTSGDFRFLLLPPGLYTLDVSHAGFKAFRREGIVV